MMKFISRLGDNGVCVKGTASAGRAWEYESVLSIESKTAPGVRFSIQRISFGRRMELSRQVRELSRRAEFLAAGTAVQEQIEANILAQEIDAMYFRWGFVSVDGLGIDGQAATGEQLLESGPEELTREVVSAIKAQCGLNEQETKN